MLKQGDSAADAAMAMALTQVVQAAGAYVSFAGIMLVVYYDAASGKVYYLDAGFNIPLEEKKPRSIPTTGGRTALVPGFMAGVQALHERFGKLPFGRLFEPAIAVAENGQAVDASLAWFIGQKKKVLSRFPETKKIFTRPDGRFYTQGDWLRQPELAATLKQVAAQGASAMYTGPWGAKFIEVVRRNGGNMTARDMSGYRVIWQEPLHTSFHDYEVHAPGFSAWGDLECMLAFNLLELANIKQYGHYTTNAQALFWLSQITACQNLSWTWPNVPQKNLSPQERVTKETAGRIWTQMQNKTWPYLPKSMRLPAHTDGLVVVDRWGNVAAVNHTINTSLWGDTGLFVDGVSIPDSAAGQGRTMELTGPGKRLPNSMSPLVILRAGKPVAASCATGAGLHQKTILSIVNMLDFGMTPQDAVNTPAFLQNNWSDSGATAQFAEGTFDPRVLDALRALGMQVNVFGPGNNAPWGYWTGVQIEPETGHLRGGVTGVGQVSGY